MAKVEIIPAILPKDFAEVIEKVSLVKDLVKTIQIDVCDGQFVPNATWPYRKRDISFERILHEKEGLPGWQKVDFEIDLMANNPEGLVEDWVVVGATRIILHVESRGNILGAVDNLMDRVDIGLALNVDTPIDALEPYAEKIHFVQCMGIDQIGFQGQEFDKRVIKKIKEVKSTYTKLPVSVDGGVSLETAHQLIEAGADRLVVGSAIFHSDNFTEAVAKFKALGR